MTRRKRIQQAQHIPITNSHRCRQNLASWMKRVQLWFDCCWARTAFISFYFVCACLTFPIIFFFFGFPARNKVIHTHTILGYVPNFHLLLNCSHVFAIWEQSHLPQNINPREKTIIRSIILWYFQIKWNNQTRYGTSETEQNLEWVQYLRKKFQKEKKKLFTDVPCHYLSKKKNQLHSNQLMSLCYRTLVSLINVRFVSLHFTWTKLRAAVLNRFLCVDIWY